MRWANQALRWYFAPEYLHLERVDRRRPTLFVGNHCSTACSTLPLFADLLYRERGIVLRSLADRNHFKVPVWRDFVAQTGAVLGTRANCAALMRRGEHILVFPGGAREVFKHKGEAYQLIWKERFGFVQLAIEHGYTITPYATAGAEEALDLLLDSADYMNTPLAAEDVAKAMNRFIKERGSVNIVFAAAPSQDEFLVHLSRKRNIDWSRVTCFHLDEYVDLPRNHPNTFEAYLQEHIFNAVQPKQIHFIKALKGTPGEVARKYTRLIEESGGIHICLYRDRRERAHRLLRSRLRSARSPDGPDHPPR